MADIIEINGNVITDSEEGIYIDWSGWSGGSGWSGYSGWSGWSGRSGYSGKSGWTGWSGQSGLSGFSGYSAWSGWTGWSGQSGQNQLHDASGALEYDLLQWGLAWSTSVPSGFSVMDFLIPPQTLHAIQILSSGAADYMQTCDLTNDLLGPVTEMRCCSLDRPRPALATVSDKYFAWAMSGGMFVVEITGWTRTLLSPNTVEIGGISPDGRYVWGFAPSTYGASGTVFVWSGY